MNFYDFVRCTQLEAKNGDINKADGDDERIGTLMLYGLNSEHPLFSTHLLIRHTYEDQGDNHTFLVPRIVGCSIPHANNIDKRQFFTLAHFKSCGPKSPLIVNSLAETYLFIYEVKLL